MKYLHYFSFGFTLVCLAPQLAAEESNTDKLPIQEQTVTVASQVEVPLRAVSASVSVLDKAELEQLGYFSLSDVLVSLPAASLSNTGGLGKTTTMSIRGEAGFRTLVLIDGIDAADSSAPQPMALLEHQMSNGISRVEVLRGPHGFSYGADAGGVVKITTGNNSESGLNGSIAAESGAYSTTNAGVEVGAGNEVVGFSLLASQLDSDGFNSSVADEANEADGYKNTTVHGRFTLTPNDILKLEAVLRSVDGESEYDSCYDNTFSLVHDCSSDYDQKSQRIALGLQTFGEHSLAYINSDIERNNFTQSEFSFGYMGNTEKLSYIGSAEFSAGHTLVFGADDKTENMNQAQADASEKVKRKQSGIYAEYLGSFSDSFFLNMGLRQDDNDDFGTHNSYRLGAARLLELSQNRELKFKTSYGTGFRAPSLYEVSLNATYGGSELSEETSEGYDFGVELLTDDALHLEFIYFNQTVNNEIFYSLDTYTYAQDALESESSGLELSAEIPLNDNWSYSLNYTYTDSTSFLGEQRPRVPKGLANLSVLASLLDQRLKLSLHLRSSLDSYDQFATMEDYHVLSANIRYAVLENLDLYLRIENLGDVEYESVPGYYAAEASAYGGIKFSF